MRKIRRHRPRAATAKGSAAPGEGDRDPPPPAAHEQRGLSRLPPSPPRRPPLPSPPRAEPSGRRVVTETGAGAGPPRCPGRRTGPRPAPRLPPGPGPAPRRGVVAPLGDEFTAEGGFETRRGGGGGDRPRERGGGGSGGWAASPPGSPSPGGGAGASPHDQGLAAPAAPAVSFAPGVGGRHSERGPGGVRGRGGPSALRGVGSGGWGLSGLCVCVRTPPPAKRGLHLLGWCGERGCPP